LKGALLIAAACWVLLCAAPGIAVCADPAKSADPTVAEGSDWTKTTAQRFETLEGGSRVRAVNPHGNVYARFGGYENQLEVLSTGQRIEFDRPELEVRIDRSDEGVELTVGPAPGSTDASGVERRDRIDLVLFVPLGATLDVRTVDGAIEAKGLKGELIASTTSGEIRIRGVEGRVRAKSVRGRISVALENATTDQPQELTTETGDIEAYLWEDAAMRVEVATSGRISTDFSLEIEHRRFEEPGKRATAVVGPGGPKLTLSSKRGAVSLLRLPRE